MKNLLSSKFKYLLISVFMCFILCFNSNASVINEIIVDDANLFTESEIQTLESKALELESEHNIDVVILTTNNSPINYSTDNKARSYIEDYVDARTQDGDNVIGICVDMGERSYALDLTGNKMFSYFPDNKQIKIEDDFVPYLSDGNYYSAAYVFLSDVDSIMSKSPTSTNYSVGGSTTDFGLSFSHILFGLFGGLFVTVLMTMTKLSQHKEKEVKKEAHFYANPSDLVLTTNSDVFVRKYTTKTRKQSSSSSGGGGRTSTNRSSSGRSHSGRSGRF